MSLPIEQSGASLSRHWCSFRASFRRHVETVTAAQDSAVEISVLCCSVLIGESLFTRYRLAGRQRRASVISCCHYSSSWAAVFQETLGLAQRIAVALAVCAVLIHASYGSLPWVSLAVSSSFALYGAMRKNIR